MWLYAILSLYDGTIYSRLCGVSFSGLRIWTHISERDWGEPETTRRKPAGEGANTGVFAARRVGCFSQDDCDGGMGHVVAAMNVD